MFCRHCGAPIPDDSSFCPACGKAVGTADQTVILDRRGVVTYNRVGSLTYEALEELALAAMAADGEAG